MFPIIMKKDKMDAKLLILVLRALSFFLYLYQKSFHVLITSWKSYPLHALWVSLFNGTVRLNESQ